MPRTLKFVLIAASTLLALVVVALLYLQFGDLRVWTDNIEQTISKSSGYDVAINGSFELDIGAEIAVSAGAITVSNPGSTSDSRLLAVEDFQIAVDTWSLLSGPVRVTALAASDAVVDLRIDSNGVNNWQLEATEAEDPSEEKPPLLDQIKLDSILISYGDESGQNAAASIRAMLDFAELSISGDRIVVVDSRVALDVGSIALKGQIDFNEAGRPKIVATITSPRLEFGTAPLDEETPPDQQSPDSDTESTLIFSDAPLQESWLNAANFDIAILVQQLLVGAETIEDFNATVAVGEGALSIAPLAFIKGDGEVSGELSLEPENNEFALNLSFAARQIRLSALASEGQDPGTVPPLDLSVELSGSGQSMHEIAASSSGQLSGSQQAGLVDMQNSGFLFSDIVTSVFRTINPLAESEPFAELECSVIELRIDDGVATIDELAAQLDRLMIVGSGNINLETEELDLTIRTKTREGLGLSLGGVVNSLLAVGGTISEPALTIDPAGSVTTAGAAVATGGLSVLAKGLWDRLSAETDICNEAAN